MTTATIEEFDEPAGAVDAGAGRVRRELLRELLKSKTFGVGVLTVAFWVVCALFGTLIAPHSPYSQNLAAVNEAPSAAHWFGTDQLGRDVLSRVLVGSRSVLVIAFSATVLATATGTILGLLIGYLRGLVDEIASRFIEALIVVPVIVTALFVVAALGPSDITITLAIGFMFAPNIARTVRTAVLEQREREYIIAAQLRHERLPYILLVELLPNVLPQVIVEFTIRLGYAIFIVATLSFLGLGVQVPTPDWGLDISTNVSVLTAGYWWEVLFDAGAIASLVVGINLIVDAIERVTD